MTGRSRAGAARVRGKGRERARALASMPVVKHQDETRAAYDGVVELVRGRETRGRPTSGAGPDI
ncbi:hypothetical protein GCM10010439_37280 [Actinocorallia aurantiaca]|uniref:Uncharacterized protein n=1 Tax=Actinocorallia aurantiaca TaxID=46204 RepID=A0ABN3UCH3_9ACTN